MELKKHLISENASIKEALISINSIGNPNLLTLFVVDSDYVLLGSLTDGDIRRGLIKGCSINNSIQNVYFKGVKYIIDNGTPEYEKVKYLRKHKIKLVPFVDNSKRIIKILDFSVLKSLLPVDAVIMAGGKGNRLMPLTKDIPKPLLKVGNKEILSYNIDRLYQFGIKNQFISVNYLKDKIIAYCESYSNRDINFSYTLEKDFLGTAAALTLIDGFKNDTILLMNSDILTNIDYEDFYKTFASKNVDLLIASIPYEINLPYAILKEYNQKIISIQEKPKYTYYANAGIYLLKKKLVNIIPSYVFYNATDLIDDSIKKGFNVSHYPIRNYWLDIGKHEDFEKAQRDIFHIDFE